jgi:hypothetical protein
VKFRSTSAVVIGLDIWKRRLRRKLIATNFSIPGTSTARIFLDHSRDRINEVRSVCDCRDNPAHPILTGASFNPCSVVGPDVVVAGVSLLYAYPKILNFIVGSTI